MTEKKIVILAVENRCVTDGLRFCWENRLCCAIPGADPVSAIEAPVNAQSELERRVIQGRIERRSENVNPSITTKKWLT